MELTLFHITKRTIIIIHMMVLFSVDSALSRKLASNRNITCVAEYQRYHMVVACLIVINISACFCFKQ